jgi:hypothetical protein
MKFVIAWTVRDKSAEAQKAIVSAFEAWTPPEGVGEMLSRADGQGGGMIVETDDAAVLRDICMPFSAWLDYDINPVIGVQDAVDAIKSQL